MSVLAPWFRAPSPDDLENVVREHGPQVFRHLKRIFGPQADVDDVFQMVFIEVLRSLPTFEGRSKLSTWIRRITWNVAYQEMRLQYRQPKTTSYDEWAVEPTDAENVDGVDDAEEVAARRQTMARLYACLETLDPKQRMPVVLHDIEGRTLKEISKSLGRPLQTVASQLHAGRAQLAAGMRGDSPRRRRRDSVEDREVKTS